MRYSFQRGMNVRPKKGNHGGMSKKRDVMKNKRKLQNKKKKERKLKRLEKKNTRE